MRLACLTFERWKFYSEHHSGYIYRIYNISYERLFPLCLATMSIKQKYISWPSCYTMSMDMSTLQLDTHGWPVPAGSGCGAVPLLRGLPGSGWSQVLQGPRAQAPARAGRSAQRWNKPAAHA